MDFTGWAFFIFPDKKLEDGKDQFECRFRDWRAFSDFSERPNLGQFRTKRDGGISLEAKSG
jgi:hypothetical protein